MKLPLKETIMTGVCVTILLGLGTWQVQRLQWKTGIIDRLNTAYQEAGKSAALSGDQLSALALQHDPLTYGHIEGRLIRNKAILLGPKTEDGRMGYDLLVPLDMKDHTLIVNTGWVSDLWKDNIEERLAALPVDEINLRGVIHKPDWTSFTSKNSPANDLWFRADINEIAAAKDLKSPYPFILYADSISPQLYDVKLHEERWLPRNQHLQYAIFWYSMAAVMLAIYGFYVAGLRKKKAPESA